MISLSLFNRLRRRRVSDGQEERHLAEAVSNSLEAARGIPADTSAQWSRLHRTLESLEAVPARSGPRPVVRFTLATAAAVAILAGIYLLRGRPSPEHFATHRGEQLSVLLPDSSEVVLSHTTELAFDKTTFFKTRHVSLSGEAFFVVRKTGSPFVVSDGATTVSVVGTQFNLKVRNGSYEVGVNEGTVKVTTAASSGDTTVLLHAGELLSGIRGATPEPPKALDAATYPGWKFGRILAERASLASVCREIEDRFNVSIELREPSLTGRTLSGMIVGADAATMIATLARLVACNYRHDRDTYILY